MPKTVLKLLGRNDWTGLIVRTALVLVVAVAAYCLLWLGPQMVRPHALATVHKTLGQQHAQLAQSRLALAELTTLEATAANFNDRREQHLKQLAEQAALPAPKWQWGLLSNERRRIAEVVAAANEVISQQKALAGEATGFGTVVRHLYVYPAEQDLGLDPATEKDALVDRATNAAAGLHRMIGQLNNLDAQQAALRTSLQHTRDSLQQLKDQLNAGQTAQATDTRISIITQFAGLRAQAWSIERLSWTGTDAQTLQGEADRALKAYVQLLADISAQRRR